MLLSIWLAKYVQVFAFGVSYVSRAFFLAVASSVLWKLEHSVGVSQVASIFDGSCQIHWQDPQRKLATTAKSTNRIRSGSYQALPNSHRIRWRVAKFRQDPQTGSAQPLPNSTQDPQDRIRNHCQISTGSVKQDPQPLPNFPRIRYTGSARAKCLESLL